MDIANVCIGICKLHLQYKLCKGCYRSPLELRLWSYANDAKKQEILANIEARKQLYGDINDTL